MKKRYRLIPILALAAAVAGCFGSPTGPEDEPKEDTDDGTGKADLVALVSAPFQTG